MRRRAIALLMPLLAAAMTASAQVSIAQTGSTPPSVACPRAGAFDCLRVALSQTGGTATFHYTLTNTSGAPVPVSALTQQFQLASRIGPHVGGLLAVTSASSSFQCHPSGASSWLCTGTGDKVLPAGSGIDFVATVTYGLSSRVDDALTLSNATFFDNIVVGAAEAAPIPTLSIPMVFALVSALCFAGFCLAAKA